MINCTITRKALLLLFLIPALLLGGCTDVPQEDIPEYIIVGTWGMVSGLYQSTHDTSVRYEKLHENKYYTLYEFKEDGVLIQTQHLGIKLFGRYEYDANASTITYGWEPFKDMFKASIEFKSADEMTMTTSDILGVLTQNFVRIPEIED